MSTDEPLRIEISGLRCRARVGVTDEELEIERPIEIDVGLSLTGARATETDRLADTVDYAAVAALAAELTRAQPHRTLERLATRIADAIVTRFGVDGVEVRVTKPDPSMAEEARRVAVAVRRGSLDDHP